MNLTSLSTILNKKRNLGKVVVKIHSNENSELQSDSIIQRLDNFTEQLGFHRLSDKWVEVSTEEAYNILYYLLTHSIAYNQVLTEDSNLDVSIAIFFYSIFTRQSLLYKWELG